MEGGNVALVLARTHVTATMRLCVVDNSYGTDLLHVQAA